jgi:hypothetical protein
MMPGPGSYFDDNLSEKSVRSHKKIATPLRNPTVLKASIPGPGDYFKPDASSIFAKKLFGEKSRSLSRNKN